MYGSSQQPLLVSERSNNGLVTVDIGGCIRLWETGLVQLERSLDEWHKMVGTGKYLSIIYLACVLSMGT